MKTYRRGLSKQQRRAMRIRTGHGRRYRVSPRRRRKLVRSIVALVQWAATTAALNAAVNRALSSSVKPGGDTARLRPGERVIPSRQRYFDGGVLRDEAGEVVRIRRDTVVCPAGSAELRRGLDAARQRLGPSRGGGVIVIDRQRIDADSGLTATAEPFRGSRPLDSAD